MFLGVCLSVFLFTGGPTIQGPGPTPSSTGPWSPSVMTTALASPLPRHKVKLVKLPILDMFKLVQLGPQCAGCPPTSSDLYDRQVGGWYPTGMLSCFDMELVTLKCDFL